MKKRKMTSNTFNLYRHAMGWDWTRYRPEFQWFDLDSIVGGQNSEWNELVGQNPSLKNALYEVHSKFYGDKMNFFQERYNVDEQTVKKFFTVYVGYHPAYGMYMCSVGPYYGRKAADEMNKFAYFTFRFASTDSRNIIYK